MKRVFLDLPFPVRVAVITFAAVAVLLAILVPVLGGARDRAFAENRRLTGEIGSTTASIKGAAADYEYATDNMAQFEALLESDRLIPHTRRAAVLQLQQTARAHGLTGLNYNFAAAQLGAVAGGSKTTAGQGAYRVSIEDVTLKVDAPTDGAIYNFIADITEEFPGAAVLRSVALTRPPQITAQILSQLSQGGGAVTGEVIISWRTAQAEDQKVAEKAK